MKFQAEYVLLKAFFDFLASRGPAGRIAWGRRLGRFWYAIDGRHRRLAIDNIARGLGVDEGRAVEIAKKNFEHLGCNVAEFAALGRKGEEPPSVSFDGLDHLGRALSGGKGAFLVSGHFGNWELTGSVLSRSYPVSVVARPMKNPLSERLISERRQKGGMKVIGHRNSTRQIVKCIVGGEIVAVLLDQNTHHREAVFVHFLGRPASVNFGLALLAIKTEAPVIPGFTIRGEDMKHRGYIGPPIELVRCRDRREELGVNSARFTAALEEFVRRYPEQWFWVHNRWKNRPPPGENVYGS